MMLFTSRIRMLAHRISYPGCFCSLLGIAAWTSTHRFETCMLSPALLRRLAQLSAFLPMRQGRVQWIEECSNLSQRTCSDCLRLQMPLRPQRLPSPLPILSATIQQPTMQAHRTTFLACSKVYRLAREMELPSHHRPSTTLLLWHPNPLRSRLLLHYQ
jgi:hypothetical protein